eukprot:382398-Lingulodinium_polyedra.AAC.1
MHHAIHAVNATSFQHGFAKIAKRATPQHRDAAQFAIGARHALTAAWRPTRVRESRNLWLRTNITRFRAHI